MKHLVKKRLKSKHKSPGMVQVDPNLDIFSGINLFPDKVKHAAKILKESPFPKELLCK